MVDLEGAPGTAGFGALEREPVALDFLEFPDQQGLVVPVVRDADGLNIRGVIVFD